MPDFGLESGWWRVSDEDETDHAKRVEEIRDWIDMKHSWNRAADLPEDKAAYLLAAYDAVKAERDQEKARTQLRDDATHRAQALWTKAHHDKPLEWPSLDTLMVWAMERAAKAEAERDKERERARQLEATLRAVDEYLEDDFGGFYLSAPSGDPIRTIRDRIRKTLGDG